MEIPDFSNMSAFVYLLISMGFSSCSSLLSHLTDLPSANISSHSSMLTFQRPSFYLYPQPLPCLSLRPRHPWLGWKRHPASVPRVQPESLLEDLGRQHRDAARAPVPQRLFRALGWKQHVPGRRGPPQVPRSWTHQERVWLLCSSERWLQTLLPLSELKQKYSL